MKDQMKGKIINEFVGLKPQMYSLIKIDVEENENEKGDDKNVVKNTRHKEHVDVLFNKKNILDDVINSLVYFHKDIRNQ